jgi:hypothetical protein
MFKISNRFNGPVYQQAAEGSGATSPFSSQTSAGGIVASGCHECECELVFAEVMERVLRVKNMCLDDVCRVEDFASFRRRNLAISADYAAIYLQPLGEAKRLKFAGGAAFGSTHVGFGMDLAMASINSWGNRTDPSEADLILPDGRGTGPDVDNLPLDLQEGVAGLATNVGRAETLTGLRRLVYGNLAIYMDLGAVLWFCQLHEQRFNYFRDGKTTEFLACFDRFVAYVKSNHAQDHGVYGPAGSFGDTSQSWLIDGLRAIAENRPLDSLSIIDHEQRNILQNFMYTLGPGVSGADRQTLGEDGQFKNFMNALEIVQFGNGLGDDARFHGIRAIFSAVEQPYLLSEAVIAQGMQQVFPLRDQPLVYLYDNDVYGDDFTNPDSRTPWFKKVVEHFVDAENNDFDWPDARQRSPYRRNVFARGGNIIELSMGPPDLSRLLYADLGRIRGLG